MKVSARNAEAFSATPPPDVRAVLVHGRDAGLIHERVKKLGHSVVADLKDPFQVSELSGSEVKSDPARLCDEAAAQSLMGGKRVVFVRLGGEDITPALTTLFDSEAPGSLVILEAGDLAASSAVRKFMEKQDQAAVIACYEDNNASLGNFIAEVGRDHAVSFSRDATDYLVAHLGSDRMVSRREIEKLILYAGEKPEISLEDAIAVIGDNGALSIEEIIYAAASGDRQVLETGLSRAASEGISPIALLRAAQRHFHRLQMAAAAVTQGKSPAEAVKSLRPPVLFLFTDRFQSQLRIWTAGRLDAALQILTEAELQCKSTGFPDRSIGERTLLRLAQVARAA